MLGSCSCRKGLYFSTVYLPFVKVRIEPPADYLSFSKLVCWRECSFFYLHWYFFILWWMIWMLIHSFCVSTRGHAGNQSKSIILDGVRSHSCVSTYVSFPWIMWVRYNGFSAYLLPSSSHSMRQNWIALSSIKLFIETNVYCSICI